MADKHIDVLEIGSPVHLWDNVPARILAIMVDNSGVSYRVAYWNGGKLDMDWIPGILVTKIDTTGSPVRKIGLNQRS